MVNLKMCVNNRLNNCQELLESIQNLQAGFDEYKKYGGRVKLVIYPKEGSMCESYLSDKAATRCINTLIDEYRELLNSLEKDICSLISDELAQLV